MLLAQGSDTFTYDRVFKAVEDAIQTDYEDSTGLFEDFAVRWGSHHPEARSVDDGAPWSQLKCDTLLAAAESPTDHIKRLDQALSASLDFVISFPTLDAADMAWRACCLLSRMSPQTRRLSDLSSDVDPLELPVEDFVQNSPREIQNLRVSHYIPTVLLQLAVQAILPVHDPRFWNGQATQSFANMIAQLLETLISDPVRRIRGERRFLIVHSFLWNLWQRAISLHRWYVLKRHLEYGFTYGVHRTLELRGRSLEDGFRCQDRLGNAGLQMFPELPHGMHRPAFESLRWDLTLVGTDFSSLISRYSEAFPIDFQDSVGESRGMHAAACPGDCYRVFPEEQSHCFASVPQAIEIERSKNGLRFCNATERTMIISRDKEEIDIDAVQDHLVSINSCLHEQYRRVALRHGCDSYWLRTICLPVNEDHRQETLGLMNPILGQGQLTLIHDAGVDDLSVPDLDTPDVEAAERFFATFLVCRWSTSAWGFLEAAKGARSLYVLCRNDNIIPLHALFGTVHAHGSVDLSAICLSSYWLLKPNRVWALSSVGTRLRSNVEASGIKMRRHTRTLGVEEAGRILSHREVPNTCDLLVIWSLLLGLAPIKDTPYFWWHIRQLRTSFFLPGMPHFNGTGELDCVPVTSSMFVHKKDCPVSSQWWAPHQDQWAMLAEYHPPGTHHRIGLDAVWQYCNLESLGLRQFTRSTSRHVRELWNELRWTGSSREASIRSIRSFNQRPPVADEWHAPHRVARHFYSVGHNLAMCQLSSTARQKLCEFMKPYTHLKGCLALIRPCCGHDDHSCDMLSVGNEVLYIVHSEIGDKFEARYRCLERVFWESEVPLPSFDRKLILLGP